MSEPQIGTGLSDIKVEMGTPSAAVEQQSPEISAEKKREMVTTEPKTILEPEKAPEALVKTEPEKPEPSAEDKANATARQAIEDRIRAENAERTLKELQPKSTLPDKKPDINDKSTWGDKYKDAPNDLETFLQARDEWAEAQGEKRAQDHIAQHEESKRQFAIKTAVAQKENESRAKHADYDAAINPIVPIIANTPILKDFIAKNPMGTEVAYELGKNPVILEQLMRSDLWTAGEQLLNMAARLKAPKAVEITNAPEPIKPVGSRETVKPRIAELADKDINGFMALRNKQELAKRRRAN